MWARNKQPKSIIRKSKESFRRLLLAATMPVILLSSTIFPFFALQIAYARDNSAFTLRWQPDNNNTRAAINDSINDNGIGSGSGFQRTQILASDSLTYGPQTLEYNQWWSDNHDSPSYSKFMYCSIAQNGVTRSWNRPSNSRIYLTMLFTVSLDSEESRQGGNSNREDFVDMRRYYTIVGFVDRDGNGSKDWLPGGNGAAAIRLPGVPADPNSNNADIRAKNVPLDGKAELKRNSNYGSNDPADGKVFRRAQIDLSADEWDDGDFIEHMNALGWNGSQDNVKDRLQARLNDCIPGPREGRNTSNFQKLSQGDQRIWENMFGENGIPTPGGGSGTLDDSDDEPACGANANFALSWILCPIIEVGGDLVQNFFRNTLEPMLESVPITSETDDPGFRAWNSFRFLANIILIGALLILVYGMLRGGGG